MFLLIIPFIEKCFEFIKSLFFSYLCVKSKLEKLAGQNVVPVMSPRILPSLSVLFAVSSLHMIVFYGFVLELINHQCIHNRDIFKHGVQRSTQLFRTRSGGEDGLERGGEREVMRERGVYCFQSGKFFPDTQIFYSLYLCNLMV